MSQVPFHPPALKPILLRSRQGSASVAEPSSRLPEFVRGPKDAMARLRRMRVAVFGCGSVGHVVAKQLARYHPAVLYLADPKSLSRYSPLTHDTSARCVGQNKSLALGRACKHISPKTTIYAFAGRAEDLPWPVFLNIDLGVMATDRLDAEDLIGERMMNAGRPLVHASVYGPTLTAQVKFFANADGQGPCPTCGFGALEHEQLRRQVRYSCENYATDTPTSAPHPASTAEQEPTLSPNSTCAMAGTLAAHQVLRHVLALGNPISDTLLDYCGYTHQIITTPLGRNPRCTRNHARFATNHSPEPLCRVSLALLVAAVGWDAHMADLSFVVGPFSWVERGACACSKDLGVHRFIPQASAALKRCRRCRERRRPHPFHTYPRPTPELLGESMNVPLRDLGVASLDWLLIRRRENTSLFLNPVIDHS